MTTANSHTRALFPHSQYTSQGCYYINDILSYVTSSHAQLWSHSVCTALPHSLTTQSDTPLSHSHTINTQYILVEDVNNTGLFHSHISCYTVPTHSQLFSDSFPTHSQPFLHSFGSCHSLFFLILFWAELPTPPTLLHSVTLLPSPSIQFTMTVTLSFQILNVTCHLSLPVMTFCVLYFSYVFSHPITLLNSVTSSISHGHLISI